MVSKQFWAGFAALVFAASAQSAPISLTANVAANSHLATGQLKSFDISVNSLLAANNLGSGAITSGQLTVSAFSEAALVHSQLFDYRDLDINYRPKPGNCNQVNCTAVDYIYTDYYTSSYADWVADTMWIIAGNAAGSDSADLQAGTLSDYVLDTQPWYKSGNDRDGWLKYFNSVRQSSNSYSGALSVTLDLDATALADLTTDGILSFFVWDSWGQFDLTGFQLNLQAQENSTPANDVIAQVPVPTTLLLTGLGLAALGRVRRRKA